MIRVSTILLAIAIVGVQVGASFAATIQVNACDDSLDASCDLVHCSLREALAASNDNGEPDLILLPACTIEPAAVLSIDEPGTTIDGGPGAVLSDALLPPTLETFQVQASNAEIRNVSFLESSNNPGIKVASDGGVFADLQFNCTGESSAIAVLGSNNLVSRVSGNCQIVDTGSSNRFEDLDIQSSVFEIRSPSDGAVIANSSFNRTGLLLLGGSRNALLDRLTLDNSGIEISGSGHRLVGSTSRSSGLGARVGIVASQSSNVQIGSCAPGDGNVVEGFVIGVAVSSSSDVSVDCVDVDNVELGVVFGAGDPVGVENSRVLQANVTARRTAIVVEGADVSVDSNRVDGNPEVGIEVRPFRGADDSYSGAGDDRDAVPAIRGNTISGAGVGIRILDALASNLASLSADNSISGTGSREWESLWSVALRVIDERGDPVAGADVGGMTSGSDGFVPDGFDLENVSGWRVLTGLFDDGSGPASMNPQEWTATLGGRLGVLSASVDGTSGSAPSPDVGFPFAIGTGRMSRYYVAEIVLPDASAPLVSITSPRDGATFEQGTMVTFETEIRDQEDSDLGLMRWTWESDRDGLLLVDEPIPAGRGAAPPVVGTPSFATELSVGTHVVTVTVEDSSGLTGSDQVSVIVLDPTNTACANPPTIAVVSPSDGADVPRGTAIEFAAMIADADLPQDALVLSWTSDRDGDLAREDDLGAGTFGFETSALSGGVHRIRARVTDLCPLSSDDAVFVRIADPFADCDDDGIPDGEEPDGDGDGVPDDCDNCPMGDSDGDLFCDECPPGFDRCEPCDTSQPGECRDNCPLNDNPDQADRDDDGVGDECDNCPDVPNPDQADGNGDGVGDACPDDPPPPPPAQGPCGSDPCEPADLLCKLDGSCEAKPEYGNEVIEDWFLKAANDLVTLVRLDDPRSLNVIATILEEVNRGGDILDQESRDRIREIADDLVSTFWPGQRPLFADLLELEGDDDGELPVDSGPMRARRPSGGFSCSVSPAMEVEHLPGDGVLLSLVALALMRRRRAA